VDLPFAADALPDHHVPAAIDRRAVSVPAHVGADLDRGSALDVEVLGLELQRVPRRARELEYRFDGGTSAHRADARGQHLRVLGVAGGDVARVVEREELQEALPGLRDARACVCIRGHGERTQPTFSLR
jgi:hypothetical protein